MSPNAVVSKPISTQWKRLPRKAKLLKLATPAGFLFGKRDDRTPSVGVTTVARRCVCRVRAWSKLTLLPGTVVSIVSSPDGQRSRFETGAVDAGATVFARLHFKDSHADLVLSFCRVSGWSDMPPAALLELISNTAQGLGARPRSDVEITAAANDAVDHVVAKVEGMRQNGGLAVVNAGYKRYRLGQVAKVREGSQLRCASGEAHAIACCRSREVRKVGSSPHNFLLP